MEAFIEPLIRQGGFALLAGVALYLLYQMGKLWAADNKASAVAVEAMQRDTLQALRDNTIALTTLTERLGGPPRRRSTDTREIPRVERKPS